MKHTIYRAVLRAGFEIRPRWDDWRRLPSLIATPETIIDVGVGRGTPYLYDAFPDAELMLIEPLREFAPSLDAILNTRTGKAHLVAVGSTHAEATMHVTDDPQRSSMHTLAAWRDEGEPRQRTVPVTTLDSLTQEHRPSVSTTAEN